ncbi:hypothetical protein [Gaoshiqia sp. Z1-71]|uniref:hypothetical protein n=1 Tax=Gaoshiqia hydrogeniformans TaxID=3290090 RepID=UPI003BF8B53B
MKMKNKLTAFLMLLTLSLALPLLSPAQGKKPGGPPPWAPAHGYRAKTRHVYFPEHNFYYDVQKGVYIYLNGRNWQVGVNLPLAFVDVNLRRAAKVELDLHTDRPQQYNAEHIANYKDKGKSGGWATKGKTGHPGKGNKN